MRERQRVLFLCTGNSARSQIAESLVNHFLGDWWEAHSAGTVPAGFVHPLAIRALREWGIGVASLRSKSVEEFAREQFHFVFTLCDDAQEHCPNWIGSGRVRHLSFPDPARIHGDLHLRLDVFRQVRNSIWQVVREHLAVADRELSELRA